MELPEIVEFARNFATMIRVKGPDPKGLKMRNHAFHHYNSGTTSLSASGMLLPDNLRSTCLLKEGENSSNLTPGSAVVVSLASIIEPFLAMRTKEANVQALPELIPHAQIDVMIERRRGTKQSMEGMDKHEVEWFPAQILRLVDVPASSLGVKLLIEASSPSLEHSWEVGWSLGAHIDHPNEAFNAVQSQEKDGFISSSKNKILSQESSKPDVMGQKITRIVFLLVPNLWKKDLPEIRISPSCKRGDFLVAMGSPFGILSPVHFFNSVSAGFIANCYPPTSYDRSLLMADIRCLPGMEGAPIFDEGSNLIGLLTKPLRQNGGAEIQLVISWKAIEAACRDSCRPLCRNEGKDVQFIRDDFGYINAAAMHSSNSILSTTFIKKLPTSCCASSLVEQAMASVCLVAVGNGVWASGVVLNSEGLILTNAHLVEPWRFGGKTVNGCKAKEPFNESAGNGRADEYYKAKILWPNSTSLDHLYKGHESDPAFSGSRKISVRLDHVDPWVWYAAKVVYVCQGTLDISLLKLESVRAQLCPISVDLSYPAQGSKAFVIGHGLLGPRSGMYPSISSGVIAQVVKSKILPGFSISSVDSTCRELPAMIETTAAVYPGSSGGAVVNSAGRMIGLVTSNAKHGGQTIIPHMNFSIPCAALEPIFKFATDMKNISLLHELDKPNKELSSVWSMMPPLPAEPGPSIPGVQDLLKDKQGKGSRFAKFIAEREELFKKPNQVKTAMNLPRDTIPSKL